MASYLLSLCSPSSSSAISRDICSRYFFIKKRRRISSVDFSASTFLFFNIKQCATKIKEPLFRHRDVYEYLSIQKGRTKLGRLFYFFRRFISYASKWRFKRGAELKDASLLERKIIVYYNGVRSVPATGARVLCGVRERENDALYLGDRRANRISECCT